MRQRPIAVFLMVAAMACAPAATDPAPAAPSSDEVRSVFTDLSPDGCTTFEASEEEAWSRQACPGTGGYELIVEDADARQSVTVVSPDGIEHPQDYWRVITHGFSVLGDQAEWRVRGEGDEAEIIALIVPVHADEFDADGYTTPQTYLAVSRFADAEVCVVERIDPVPDAAEAARASADASAGMECLWEVPGTPPSARRFCYVLEEATLTAVAAVDVLPDGALNARVEATIHDEANSYYSSYVQRVLGAGALAVLDGGVANVDVESTIWIEYDVQEGTESWEVSADALRGDAGDFAAVDCSTVDIGWAHESLGIDESPIHTQTIVLERGTPLMIEGGVVRGERDQILFEAEGGLQLELRITSVEDNAVFDVIDPAGLILVQESMSADLILPHSGQYQIIVGGTRGNAGYELHATLR